MRNTCALFLLLAVGALALDCIHMSDTRGFMLRPLGQAWFQLDRESWLLLQPAIERHVHKDLWFAVIEPITRQPAVLLFAGIGAFFYLIGYIRGRVQA